MRNKTKLQLPGVRRASKALKSVSNANHDIKLYDAKAFAILHTQYK